MSKEPWEMTKAEFRDQELAEYVDPETGKFPMRRMSEHRAITNKLVNKGLDVIGVPEEQRTPYRLNSATLVNFPSEAWIKRYQELGKISGKVYTDVAHLALIDFAIQNGKHISNEVLKDYSNLSRLPKGTISEERYEHQKHSDASTIQRSQSHHSEISSSR